MPPSSCDSFTECQTGTFREGPGVEGLKWTTVGILLGQVALVLTMDFSHEGSPGTQAVTTRAQKAKY